jgi:Tfp pilus assembly protein PilF
MLRSFAVFLFSLASLALAAPSDQTKYIEHVQKGHSYALTGMADQAIKEFEEALKYSPDDYDLHHRLGNLYGCPKGNPHLRDSMRLEPNHWQAYSDLGLCLIKQGQTKEGRSLVEQALKLNPQNPQLQYQVGLWSMEDKDYKKASGFFEAALSADPDYFDAAQQLGMARARLGETAAAEKAFRRAMVIMPNHPGPYLQLAPVLFLTDQGGTACFTLEQGAILALDLESSPMAQEALTKLQKHCPNSKAIKKLTAALRP